MFKVLVVAYYFPPLGLSGVQRTLKFVKYFNSFNWSATVITTGKIGHFDCDETPLDELKNRDVEIIRTEPLDPNKFLKKNGQIKIPFSFFRKFLDQINKILFIPDNKNYWARKAAKKASELFVQNSFDAIFISIPPFSSVMPFIKLKDKYEVPLFVDYRNAWLTNQFRFYLTPYHRYKNKKLEDKVLRKVDRIISVNRIIKEDLLKNYQFLDFKDIEIIPHGYDPEDFETVSALKKENDKLIITYSGAFYEDITPAFLLKAFKKLSFEAPDIASNIELRFVGRFNKEFRKMVQKMKLESFVKEYGYLTHIESIKMIISSDLLWLMLPNSHRMKNVTPGKMFEYFATRKPILAFLPEGAAKFNVEKYGAAFITAPDDVDAIKNILVDVHVKYLSDELPEPNEEFIAEFNKKSQTEQLIKIFQFYLKEE